MSKRIGKSAGSAGAGAGSVGAEGIEQSGGAEPISFETALERLETTVTRLEDGELPLEEALELFESGVKLSRQCATTLESAERRIEILVAERDAELGTVRPFEADQADLDEAGVDEVDEEDDLEDED